MKTVCGMLPFLSFLAWCRITDAFSIGTDRQSHTFGRKHDNHSISTLKMTKNMDNDTVNGNNISSKLFGTLLAANIISFSMTPVAEATIVDFPYFSSTSIQIADAIKTMDMSLPSYNSLSDTKASVANVAELTNDYTPPPPTFEREKKVSPKTSKEESGKSMKVTPARESSSFELTSTPGAKADIIDMSIPSYEKSTAKQERSLFSL